MLIENGKCAVTETFENLLGLEPVPTGTSSCRVVVGSSSCAISVEVELRETEAYLVCAPNVCVPDLFDLRARLNRWLFEQADERYQQLQLDMRDGELFMGLTIDGAEKVEEAASSVCDFLDEAYPAIVAFMCSSLTEMLHDRGLR